MPFKQELAIFCPTATISLLAKYEIILVCTTLLSQSVVSNVVVAVAAMYYHISRYDFLVGRVRTLYGCNVARE